MRPVFVIALGLVALAGVSAAQARIIVGAKATTEQRLLAAMTAQYLDAHGYDVRTRAGMGATVLRRAPLKNQVDLYWADVGTSLTVHTEVEGAAALSPEAAYNKVKALDAEKGLVWLAPTDAHRTVVLAMRAADAEDMGIATLSDLVAARTRNGGFTLGVTSAWAGRPDGLVGFQARYDIRWPRGELRRMQTDRVAKALKAGAIDVGVVSATDGRIAAFDLRVLRDDRNAVPKTAIAPVIRRDVLDAHPGLRKHLNAIGETLNDKTMRRLTTQVNVENKATEHVAETYLKEQGLM